MIIKKIHLEPDLPSDYTTVFSAMPGASALIKPNTPEYTVVASTEEFTYFAGTTLDKLIGSSLFTYFPDNPDAPNVSGDIMASILKCIATGERNELAVQRYDIAQSDGTFAEMYWRVIHSPIKAKDGTLQYIIHTAIDVTGQTLASIKDERIRTLEPAHNLFMQSTMAIHLFWGPDRIVTLANEPTLKLWDKDRSIIGKPLREVLPELDKQPFFDIIDRVRTTGEPYHAHEAPAELHRNGKKRVGYFNFVMQPYYDGDQSRPSGVLAMVNEVTDIINDRKALQEKERNLQMAVEIGDLGVFTVDLSTKLLSYSPQIMEWFGVKRLNLSLDNLLANVHPEDRQLLRDTLTRSEAGETLRHDIYFRVQKPGSDKIHHLRSIGQLQIADGHPDTISGIIQDISETIHTKSHSELISQRLKSLIESAPFPIGVYTGSEMRIELANQTMLDTWGKGNEVIGKLYSDILPELENQEVFSQLQHVYSTGEPFHARNQRIDLIVDGLLQTYYFNYSFTPLFDAEGAVYGVMNTAADVTDLNVAMVKAAQSERNFRNMLLQAPVAMCLLTGPEYEVTIVNDKMLQLWGRDKDFVMKKPVFTALPDAAGQGLEMLMDKVYNEGATISANETPVQLIRDGKPETVYQNFVYQPYLGANGEIDGIICISIDVSAQVLARRKIEEVVSERTHELEIANNNLQRSNAALEQFAYVASHDLQEPLRKISMFTERLRSSPTTMSDQDIHFMDRIRNSVSRMTTLIRDILNYSQLSQTAEVFETIDLRSLIEESAFDFDLVLQERGGRIDIGPMPEIPAIPLQMTQLFHNLISNSVKYSRPDIAPLLQVSSSPADKEDFSVFGIEFDPGSFTKIVFSDNGIGFPQEYAEKIFTIFQRLHGKLQYEGTGIGLAMCRKIVENHNGYIKAFSEEGEGASFVILLPLLRE